MKPGDLSRKLRQIASTIDDSDRPDRFKVISDLKKIVLSMESGTTIVVHTSERSDQPEITTTNSVKGTGPNSYVDLPNGDTISFYSSLDDFLNSLEKSEDSRPCISALYNAGLAGINDDEMFVVNGKIIDWLLPNDQV
jgi:hypothetical protein